MKYIKTYEVRIQPRNFNEKHYWLVSTKPIEKFIISLKKIGYDNPRNIEEWCKILIDNPLFGEKIYVIHVEDADEYIVNDYWTWEGIDTFSPEKNDFYEGEIEVSDMEVEAEKHNM